MRPPSDGCPGRRDSIASHSAWPSFPKTTEGRMTTSVELPYPPLVILALEGPIRWSDIEKQIKDRLPNGVSICVVSARGEENHGGYFFHIKKTREGYMFRTFDRD